MDAHSHGSDRGHESPVGAVGKAALVVDAGKRGRKLVLRREGSGTDQAFERENLLFQ